MSDEKGYNGWKNYETWSVGLILDNEHALYQEVREVVRDAVENGEPSEYWTEDERRKYRTADALKDYVERGLEYITEPNEQPLSYLVSQLVSAALSEVDWEEFAEHYLSELEEAQA